MTQFDVFRNVGKLKAEVPFVLDVQSNLVSTGLSTTIVVPLYLAKYVHLTALKIHIPLTIEQKKFIALFDEVAAVERARLGTFVVSLGDQYGQVFRDALDVLFFNIP